MVEELIPFLFLLVEGLTQSWVICCPEIRLGGKSYDATLVEI